MINRRYLRIKVLQTLYSLEALQKSEDHEGELALREQFSSYKNLLDKYEEEDKETLKILEEVAVGAYHSPKEAEEKLASLDEEYREPVGQVVAEAIDQRRLSLNKNSKALQKTMVKEAESLGERYLSILRFFEVLKSVAENVEGNRPNGALDIGNLKNNKALRMLQRVPELTRAPKMGATNWDKERVELQEWYTDIVRKKDYYKDYLFSDNPDFEADKELLRKLLKDLLFKHERATAFMESQDLHWEENRAILRSMSNKTLKNLDPSIPVPELAVLSTNWEDDRRFFERLFSQTVKRDADLEEMIAEKAQNWAADRIAQVDMIILKMAIAEMVEFETIPVKVSLNEYLELAKLYSSPKSKQFINGLLDRIQLDLQKEGKIRKTGRGLVDN